MVKDAPPSRTYYSAKERARVLINVVRCQAMKVPPVNETVGVAISSDQMMIELTRFSKWK